MNPILNEIENLLEISYERIIRGLQASQANHSKSTVNAFSSAFASHRDKLKSKRTGGPVNHEIDSQPKAFLRKARKLANKDFGGKEARDAARNARKNDPKWKAQQERIRQDSIRKHENIKTGKDSNSSRDFGTKSDSGFDYYTGRNYNSGTKSSWEDAARETQDKVRQSAKEHSDYMKKQRAIEDVITAGTILGVGGHYIKNKFAEDERNKEILLAKIGLGAAAGLGGLKLAKHIANNKSKKVKTQIEKESSY